MQTKELERPTFGGALTSPEVRSFLCNMEKQDPIINHTEEYFYYQSLDKETLIEMLLERNKHIQDLYDQIQNNQQNETGN
jgi:hypothetical protein